MTTYSVEPELSSLVFDAAGLIPVIVQDSLSQQVLMLGYMNRESLDLSIETKLVTFWSRSRNELWVKGQTSGNILSIVDISTDCDFDALLILATPAGPTCHTGQTSCFEIHEN